MMQTDTAVIHIIGTPIPCPEGFKDSWRQVAHWLSGRLQRRYGTAVSVRYFDLFDPGCPPIPAETQLPLVLLDGEPISSGDKISLPNICHRLDSRGPVRGRHAAAD
jgi:hypothetical protein